jgi:hypothetical protein
MLDAVGVFFITGKWQEMDLQRGLPPAGGTGNDDPSGHRRPGEHGRRTALPASGYLAFKGLSICSRFIMLFK